MSSYAFLFWGDVIVWAGLTIYVVVLVRKMASLSRRLASLEASSSRSPRAT
jgi:CcmD family protein